MTQNKARLAGGGLAAIAVALVVIALLPRVFPALAPVAVSKGSDVSADQQMPDVQTQKVEAADERTADVRTDAQSGDVRTDAQTGDVQTGGVQTDPVQTGDPQGADTPSAPAQASNLETDNAQVGDAQTTPSQTTDAQAPDSAERAASDVSSPASSTPQQTGPSTGDAALIDTQNAPQDTAPAGPTIDTFLLGPDGVAVVAGKASPGATVSVMLDGTPIGEAQADSRGGFAATAEIEAATAPRRLTFSENGGPDSGDIVLVRPDTGAVRNSIEARDAPLLAEADAPVPPSDITSAPAAQPAPVDGDQRVTAAPVSSFDTPTQGDLDDVALAQAGETPEQTPEQTSADTVAANADAPELADAPVVQKPEPVTTPAPTVIVDAQGARVLGAGPQAMDRVALDAITYDDVGDVQLAGRAPGGGNLQVYVDNRPVATGPVGPQGDWRITLPQVDAGTYTLRVDEITDDGRVTSRIETPFQRTAPEELARLQASNSPGGPVTQTVQPGNTLWAIAQDNFGDGLLYVSLFEANADQIRDPDLIYPGQVFVIPKP